MPSDQGLESFATGLANSLSSYLGSNIQANQAIKQRQAESDIAVNQAQRIAKNQKDLDQSSATAGTAVSYITPEMAEKALPGYGSQIVQDYNKRNPNSPMTIDQASDSLGKAKAMLDGASPQKDDKYLANQDKLEKQAMDRVTTVRGDQSLIKTEAQRDAAAMAYQTIAKAQSEGRHLSSVEYNDLAGQLWKARTGATVTEQELKKLAPTTAQTSADHFAAWASGNPNLIGTTSTDTENNLKQFIQSSGETADNQHEAYMKPRMIKPTDLEQARWDRISSAGRGLSFAEQKKVSDTVYKNKTSNTDINSKKAALRAKLGI
jgi:hypothetical protein